ncbi:A-agglutinin anchorage subunit [Ricinus communis]|uniref:Serine-rich protein-related n=1 Tax=Ricinus communis TaxID=3988 RepID=B9SWU6_RICCO|nr:A-agglutinin anchorage subunit [Ricinus communis]EEF31935.1 conserved hypothetical protein [Ricinus communis]|eukprot:XP_002530465.1 A-agglutinin anchorage subunit [Ricinus communis]
MPTSRAKSCRTPPPALSSTSTSAFASSTTSSFTSRSSSSSTLFARSTSPTPLNMYNRNSQPSRFSMTDHRPISPNRSISIKRQTSNSSNAVSSNKKRTCACSPTNHPGSFRCAFHRAMTARNNSSTPTASYQHSSSRLNFRRSAMTNSLVRIGGVEGELVKRALSALIRPSSHQLRRCAAFEPRPSRLSVMSTS